ncbi:DNA internalization-related competence protein ComEC/Rec2 [Metabacillus sp. KIGAM252]|uniref:DNA internalization-related competence protein ComEC/Rec2 n=1 Tax=Metabacillus flavus TaxID=2823519 RepID=A0ABS5LGA1_9BACI|nr:DNA internalization-related competence protein ComEC/Rec2 [Metabacillus flavus]
MNYVLSAAASVIAVISVQYSLEWAGILLVLGGCLLHASKNRARASVLAAAAFFIFLFLSSFHTHHSQSRLNEGAFTGRGMLTMHPVTDGDRFSARLRLDSHETIAIRLFIPNEAVKQKLQTIKGGMSCKVKGTLEYPLNPTIPNGFNYKEYLEAQSIHWILTASSVSDCLIGSTPEAALLKWRSEGLLFILRSFPPESAGIVQALIFGEREWIDQDTEKAYQRIGLIHLLAISGMQVALIAAAGRFLMMRIGLSRETSALLLFFLLPSYLIIAGGSPSVIRAVLAAELYLLFLLMKWPVHPLKLLSLLFIIWLASSPMHLFQAGFQLTFIISFCLLMSAAVFNKHRGRIHLQNLILTFLSVLSTMPLILSSFWEISLLSLLVNTCYVPLYSFILMPLSLISFLMASMQIPFWEGGIRIANWMIDWTNRMTEFISAADPFLLKLGKPPSLLLLCYTAGVIYCFWSMEKGIKKTIGAISIIAGLLIIDLILPFTDPNGSITFLDVGQGDCIVIELPYKKGTYLIDTGGKFVFHEENAEWKQQREKKPLSDYTLLPYLSSKGISHFDAVFLSHADQDHTGEYLHILNKISIAELIVPEGFVRDQTDRKLIAETIQRGAAVKTARGQQIIRKNGIQFQVLWPLKWSDSKNEDSLVLRFNLGGKWWLLTGDLEKEGEAALVNTHQYLKADVLKAGHHGSKFSTSADMMERVQPSAAIISAGRKNRYGHPHQEILTRLKEKGVETLRTDTEGTIQFLFNGETGTFRTHPPYDVVNPGSKNKKNRD